MLINLAPCNFQLQLCTKNTARRRSDTIRCARKALRLSNRICITKDISSICTVIIMLATQALPRNNGNDKNGNSATLLLLRRPINNHDTIVRFTRLIISTNVRRGPLHNNNLTHIGINASASVAMTISKYDANRGGILKN